MSQFIQLHMLTSYPPANLNRDDLGRPKTAVMGGKQRLRVSSQCLKRTWRTSEIIQEALKGHLGTRTRRMGLELLKQLQEKGADDKQAKEWAGKLASVFGTLESDQLKIKELFFFAPEEREALTRLADRLVSGGDGPSDQDLEDVLGKTTSAVDVAMFGRMMAKSPVYNIEAAAQVAHAISVHEVAVEEDYFSAVDDLNEGAEDLGAGHIGEAEFAAGLFYLYACINRDLLKDNLGGDAELADQGIRALAEAMATTAPTGKRASYGSYAYASYCLVEKGTRQPRSLSVAFLKPPHGRDMLDLSVKALEKAKDDMDRCYGPCADASYTLNVSAGTGTLPELLDFVTG